ncbi:hypothetical protein MP228_007198 [Amoeboaphelidium protococcarum]|nr:hypothetical protein MP228_007198 [Amoeboaphelidium protococcarum]
MTILKTNLNDPLLSTNDFGDKHKYYDLVKAAYARLQQYYGESVDWKVESDGKQTKIYTAQLNDQPSPALNRVIRAEIDLSGYQQLSALDLISTLVYPSVKCQWDPVFEDSRFHEILNTKSVLGTALVKGIWPITSRVFPGLATVMYNPQYGVDGSGESALCFICSVDDFQYGPQVANTLTPQELSKRTIATIRLASFYVTRLGDKLKLSMMMQMDPKGMVSYVMPLATKVIPRSMIDAADFAAKNGGPPMLLDLSWSSLDQQLQEDLALSSIIKYIDYIQQEGQLLINFNSGINGKMTLIIRVDFNWAQNRESLFIHSNARVDNDNEGGPIQITLTKDQHNCLVQLDVQLSSDIKDELHLSLSKYEKGLTNFAHHLQIKKQFFDQVTPKVNNKTSQDNLALWSEQ